MRVLAATLIVAFFHNLPSTSASYNVHWIEGNSRVEQSAQISPTPINIYCYKGSPKYIIYLWQSVILNLEIKTDAFNKYLGSTPEEVWDAYKTEKAIWNLNVFSSKKSPDKFLYLDPFNQTCVSVDVTERYALRIEIKRIDQWKITFLIVGVILFFWARSLGENTLFYYATGITIGVFASFMVLVYIISRMLPGKPIVYGSMIGGWAVGIYFFQMLWSNFQPLLVAYRNYIIWYVLVMGFISFVVCYKRGPPKDKQSKNIITWTLQILGLIAIFYSTDVIEGVIAIWISIFFIKYVPRGWIRAIRSYWIRKFPPKRVLLTEEQYYEEGVRETAKALDDLRGYCSSPDCNQWALISRLKDPSKFASFISGGSHVSVDETDTYVSDDFVIHRPKHKRPATVAPSFSEENFISDDSSFSPDEF